MALKRGSIVTAPLLLAGGIGLAYAGARALLGLKPGAEEDFFHWTGPTAKGVKIGSSQFDLPVNYYRDDSFMGTFGAAYEPVRALLPSDQLYPVTLPNGQATVIILAFNYIETDVGPYGEIAIALPCTYQRPAPALLPLALEARYPGFGGYVLHLPVTHRAARDGGRALWGFAKFIADMDFDKRPAYQRVRMSEGDRHILTLTVRQEGLPLRDNRSLVTYSVCDGQLIKTTVPTRAIYQLGLRPGMARLELGDHEIADQLRSVEISTTSFISRNFLSRCSILPEGERLGPADRPHAWRPGREIEAGRLTVRYTDAAEPIDVYARARAAASA
jgi:hypothetical protein